MNERLSAEEDLRIIRSLMERATVYRAISAPSALVAGLLSILAAGAIYYNNAIEPVLGRLVRPREFAVIWVIVLALAVLANGFFVWREAKKSGRPFLSSGMRLALRAIAPNLLIPAAFTLWFYTTGFKGGTEIDLVVVWVAFYGLALLSTALFAPRSLALLGWAFLLTSLAVPTVLDRLEALVEDIPTFVMGTAFGFYHLIYAICTWSLQGGEGAPPTATE
jgi:small-conductance mechanosensitive channel